MKKNVLLTILVSSLCYAQNGNVGIDTPNPQTSLHVKGTLRLDNPSNSDKAVLRVFKDGSMKWKKLFVVEPITGEKTIPAGIDTSTTPTYSGMRIKLPTGRWIVKLNLLIPQMTNITNNQGIWLNCYLSDSDTNSTATNDYIANSSTYFGGNIKYPARYGMVVGGVVINNTGAADKMYYLWVFQEVFPPTATTIYSHTLAAHNWYEDKIYALPFE